MIARLLRRGARFAALVLSVAVATVPSFAQAQGTKERNPSESGISSISQYLNGESSWNGTITLAFDSEILTAWNLTVTSRGELESNQGGSMITFPIRRPAIQELQSAYQAEPMSVAFKMFGAMEFSSPTESVVLVNPVLVRDAAGPWQLIDADSSEPGITWLEFIVSEVDLPDAGGELLISGEWILSDHAINTLQLAPTSPPILGAAQLQLKRDDDSQPRDDSSNIGDPVGDIGTTADAPGPDIIVGDLDLISRFGKEGDITAYAVGTVSCNIGTQRANWFMLPNTDHPVIAQNMYRLNGGRFEQIGMSWVKHGYYALSMTLCSQPNGCSGSLDGTFLGVGCSDPYDASLNGQMNNLGPRYQVNPTTGVFPIPTRPSCGTSVICRRIQIRDADFEPDTNVGALYFVEGHYVHPGDAAAGNNNNNASYRRFQVFENEVVPGEYTARVTGPTQRQKPAIQAWADNDPSVRIVNVDVPVDMPNGSRFILGYKITELEDGWYHYEYAVQNLNAHRAAGSFTVPIPAGAHVRNIGFHDINTHSTNNTSGSWFDSTDWTPSLESTQLSWRGPIHATNPDGNALRWGSLYNFRFDAQRPPRTGNLTLGLFIPGTPESLTIVASVPSEIVEIVHADPPAGATDARQPVEPTTGEPQGWNIIDLAFNAPVADFQFADFQISQVGGISPTPEIIDAQPVGQKLMRLVLSSPITPVARTTFTHIPSGALVHLNSLPGDVNGDDTTTPADIEALIDHIATGDDTLPPWTVDLNRSGSLTPEDIARGIDILNGADALDAYSGAALPPK